MSDAFWNMSKEEKELWNKEQEERGKNKVELICINPNYREINDIAVFEKIDDSSLGWYSEDNDIILKVEGDILKAIEKLKNIGNDIERYMNPGSVEDYDKYEWMKKDLEAALRNIGLKLEKVIDHRE